MSGPASTETIDGRYAGLDTWRDGDILAALLDGQRRALDAVNGALPALARAAGLAASALSKGGRLVYLASGSPALIAAGDALEIPGTYGVARERIVMLFAGGERIFHDLTGVDEDVAETAVSDVAAAGIGRDDCVLAISASGSTPYTVAGIAAAKAAGAATVAIACNRNAPMFEGADVEVLLETGAEVISGSTRMGAGTAQKAALNMLSTLIGVHLGHVYDGLMVNVKADNEKLRGRAARIVARITGADPAKVADALRQSDGVVKPAILIAAGAASRDAAERLLGETRGNVRTALERLAASAPALN
jgi:N-acetylmuramic acid 6-phosphate etherase